MPVTYFAYGSNMATLRLFQRLPKAKFIGTAKLAQHRLSFRKNDQGKSGKCDIELSGRVDDEVIGVIYEIGFEDKQILDQIEGLGIGYDEKTVELRMNSGQTLFALTYFAIDIDESMIAYHWYKQHVLRGAQEHNLPVAYIKLIQAVPSKADPDNHRSQRELAIYP